MAHLTKPKQYDIADSNIALLGSDLEKHVREQAGDSEQAWNGAGLSPGLQIWRIERFNVVQWPKERAGEFFDGDSYIILHTYKKDPENEALAYDLHFWLGQNTTQDEAGTAAFKTVELDDHLHGVPVQYREVQGFESDHFLSYFPRFVCLKGGVATGFQHVEDEQPLDIRKLYRITFTRTANKTNLAIREVPAVAQSLVEGDVYVLDLGNQIWQYNSKASQGQEKFKAAEFVQTIIRSRKGKAELKVYDEGSSGSGVFLLEFGEGTTLQPDTKSHNSGSAVPVLFKISDASGNVTFEHIAASRPARSDLSTHDAFLLDDPKSSTIFVWIGNSASLTEKRLAPQYAQRYLYEKAAKDLEDAKKGRSVAEPIVKIREGYEPLEFLKALEA